MKNQIVFFDLETTGVDTNKDRIVQIAAIKKDHKGAVLESMNLLINPEVSIPKEASEVHGITDDMVKDKPTFSEVAKSIKDFFLGCDLAGYNSDKFDIVLLDAELSRVGLNGIDWDFNSIDVLSLYRKLYPNTLSGVYERLTGKELENAHDALSDIEATIEILETLHDRHLGTDYTSPEADVIESFVNEGRKRVDVAGYFYEDEEQVIRWSLGKYKDSPVKGTDQGYIRWFEGKMSPNSFKILKNLN